MLIAVNTRFLIKNKLEGIGWFTYETMKRLVQNHPEHTFLFLFDRDFDEEFIFSKNVIPLKVWPPARHPYLWKYWFDIALPKLFKKYKPDLFISTDGFLSLKTQVPTILVIHDLGFEHYPAHTPQIVSRYYRRFTPLYARKAKRIITVSQFTKHDIVNRYKTDPAKIDVVYNGANENFKKLPEAEKLITRQNFTGGKNYFLYVGSIHPRKNVKNLLLAFDLFKKENPCDIQLVISGRMAWKTDEIKATFDEMQFKEEVVFTGHLLLNDLTRIVASADAMIYPSLFEGFGIPVLESMYCCVPVILSNSSSLPEIAGDSGIYFNPDDPSEIKNALLKFIAEKDKYTAMANDNAAIKEKFNWDRSVERIERSIQKADSRFLSKSEKAAFV